MKLNHLAALALLSLPATIALAAPTTRPVSGNAKDRVEQLIDQLGAEDFKTRAAAAAQLRKLGRVALPAIKDAKHSDPEVQAWCAALTEQLDPKPRPDLAQLLSQHTTLRTPDGGVVRLEIEQPILNRRVRGDLQRLVEVRQLLVDDAQLRQLRDVEAEIRVLQKAIEDPVQLRLVRPREEVIIHEVIPPAPE